MKSPVTFAEKGSGSLTAFRLMWIFHIAAKHADAAFPDSVAVRGNHMRILIGLVILFLPLAENAQAKRRETGSGSLPDGKGDAGN